MKTLSIILFLMPANSTKEAVAETTPEIVSTRVFRVSKELLFKAYTDPEMLANWWGPKGFSNTFHEFNLQADGNGILRCMALMA